MNTTEVVSAAPQQWQCVQCSATHTPTAANRYGVLGSKLHVLLTTRYRTTYCVVPLPVHLPAHHSHVVHILSAYHTLLHRDRYIVHGSTPLESLANITAVQHSQTHSCWSHLTSPHHLASAVRSLPTARVLRYVMLCAVCCERESCSGDVVANRAWAGHRGIGWAARSHD